MSSSFLPRTDAGLRTFAVNFATKISAAPTTYGLTAPEATAFQTLSDDFVAKLLVVDTPETRTKAAIAAKDDAALLLRRSAGDLSKKVQGTSTVTAEQKIELGLTVPDVQPTPIPAPLAAPGIAITGVDGHTVNIRLVDMANPTKRAKPAGVQGATLFSCVSETTPAEGDWKFEASVTRTRFAINFPTDLTPGTKVWITGFWFNPRSQSGPSATPISTLINYGTLAQAS